MKKLTVLLILFFTITSLFSQEKLSFTTVDKKTYEQYLQKDWKNLIKLGKQSQKENIDFYYLQYRMGIAYYELKNYRKAISFFHQVLEQYPKDEIALEYLYYSYLRSNMLEDARKLWLTFKGDFKEKNRYYNDEIILNGIGLEYKHNDVEEYLTPPSIGDTLMQKATRSLNYFNLNMKHYANGNFTFFHGLSVLTNVKTVLDPNYSLDALEEKVTQTQYYAIGNINSSEGTNFKIGFHYLHERILATGADAFSSGGWGGGSGMSSSSARTYYWLSANNIVGFAAFNKSLTNFDIQLSSSISNINAEFQVQPSLALTYYPFGNSTFYWKSEAFYQYARFEQQYTSELITTHKLGVTIAKFLSLEPFAMYGKARNFLTNNAYTVYNGLDVINYWYGANLKLKLGKHTHIYTIYQNYNYTNEYQINQNNFNINYNSKTILGGIVWNF